MKKIIVLIFVTVFLANCKNNNLKKINTKEIVVNLKTKFENNPVISSVGFIYFPDSIPKNYKGIFKEDEIRFGEIILFEKSDIDKLLDQGIITKKQQNDIRLKIDCIIGIKNNQQYFVLDQNFNKDFSDDIKITIDYFSYSSTRTNEFSMPIFKTVVDRIDNLPIYKDSVSIKFYPKELFVSQNNNVTFSNIKTSKLLFTDYLLGEFNISDIPYKMAVSKYSLFGPELIIREKDSSFYPPMDKMYHKYKLFDTLQIANMYYRIDTVRFNSPLVRLKPVSNIKGDYGRNTGDKIRDYEVTNLFDGEPYHFKNLLAKKKYLLLDFWGTWCAPCVQLTPELVRINNDYNSNLNLLSLAFQKDKNELIDYIEENNMDWNHVFLQGNAKSAKNKPTLVKTLRIEAYPTFILIDNDFNILYRGIGETALNEIEEMIKKLN